VAYRVIILPSAEADLERMDAEARRLVLRRLVWLQENASDVIHHRLTNLPDDLAGLCRFRVANHRILYWPYPDAKVLKVYRVQHRREVYRGL
jgi:mRNA-degrading endonuclease RelE of RelBE toxin-antitoxin system